MEELVWNVYYEDFNKRQIVSYNVFEHYRFRNEVVETFERNEKDFENFKKEIERSLMYYFWSKCEWEIILAPWVSAKTPEVKIDVYDQVMLNFDIFVEYIWNYYKKNKGK